MGQFTQILVTFKKWFFKFFIIFIPVILSSFLISEYFDFGKFSKIILWSFLFSCLVAFVFSVAEIYTSNARKKFNTRIIEIFDGKYISNNESKFKIGKYDVYCVIDFKLEKRKGKNIEFHIPRSQIDKKKKKPKFKLVESKFKQIRTYKVHSTEGLFLNNTCKKLKKKLILE